MAMTQLKEKTTELREKAADLMSGELTFTKLDFCLVGLVCLFAGIVIGLLTAPWTHGVSIGSNNGNNSGNTNGYNDDCDDKCESSEIDK